MRQETLQDLLVVSTTSDSIEELNHKEAISIWVSSGKNKKHFNCNFNKLKQCPKRKWQPAGDQTGIPSCYRVWWWPMNVNQHNLCWSIQTTMILTVWAALESLSSVHSVLDISNFKTWKECTNSFFLKSTCIHVHLWYIFLFPFVDLYILFITCLFPIKHCLCIYNVFLF